MYHVVLLVLFVCVFDQVYSAHDPDFGCGVSNLNSNPGDKGPHPVAPGNFPWYAAIYEGTQENEDSWKIICGGTLISPRSVLTAANCVEFKPPNHIKVALGKLRYQWNDHEPNEIKKSVAQIRIHDNYWGFMTMFANNIALLILDSGVPVSSSVCLVHNMEHVLNPLTSSGFAIGWHLEERVFWPKSEIAESNNELRYGRTSVLDHQVCVQTLNFDDFLIPKDEYCNATDLVPHQFPNMGAGLTFKVDGRHYLYGIVSRNHLISKRVKPVGTYTNVSYHYDWIKDHMI